MAEIVQSLHSGVREPVPETLPLGQGVARLGNCAIEGTGHGTTNVPQLGSESLLWRWTGDWRLNLTGLSAGVLQLMHPAIGAGVSQHSKFFEEPWQRIYRSVPEIIGTVYDGPRAEATGHRVRDYHKHIKGVDEQGRRYHALQPETWWWAHATFHNAVEQVADRFSHHNLTEAERNQLYAESVVWYQRYGVSDRVVPPNYQAFQTKWQSICDSVLEMTPAAEQALNMAINRKVVRPPDVPKEMWPLISYPASDFLRLVTIGGLPKSVVSRFSLPWSLADDVCLKGLELAVRQSWRFVPKHLRYRGRALAGYKQAA